MLVGKIWSHLEDKHVSTHLISCIINIDRF